MQRTDLSELFGIGRVHAVLRHYAVVALSVVFGRPDARYVRHRSRLLSRLLLRQRLPERPGTGSTLEVRGTGNPTGADGWTDGRGPPSVVGGRSRRRGQIDILLLVCNDSVDSSNISVFSK